MLYLVHCTCLLVHSWRSNASMLASSYRKEGISRCDAFGHVGLKELEVAGGIAVDATAALKVQHLQRGFRSGPEGRCNPFLLICDLESTRCMYLRACSHLPCMRGPSDYYGHGSKGHILFARSSGAGVATHSLYIASGPDESSENGTRALTRAMQTTH
eukprot:1825489-Pleurochrysis_carterae.AAC.13